MTSPFKHPDTPYTEYNIPSNLKSRKVKCIHCNYELMTDIPGPKCRLCKRYMVTVINGLMADTASSST